MPLKFEKPPSRAQDKRKQQRAEKMAWLAVWHRVMVRDDYKCRACGTGDPLRHVDAHHIKFRSRGGADTDQNMCALCRSCHDDIHAYRLSVVGDNANKQLRFVRRDG